MDIEEQNALFQPAPDLRLDPKNRSGRGTRSHYDFQNLPKHQPNLNRTLIEHSCATALCIVEEFRMPRGSDILAIGGKSAKLATALAQRGYHVTTIVKMEAANRMLKARAKTIGLENRIVSAVGDIRKLDFEDGFFDAVVAIGVVGWLHSPMVALTEIQRVLRKGGCLIVTLDNKWQLGNILDPRRNPALAGLRRECSSFGDAVRTMLAARSALWPAIPRFVPSLPKQHSLTEWDTIVSESGLEKIAAFTTAFGPFTIFGKRMFSDEIGKTLHTLLQRFADRHVPFVRSAGSQYFFVGRRP